MKKQIVWILLLVPIISMAQRPDFAGKWDFDSKKTDLRLVPSWLPARSFEIKQKNDAIIIEAKIYDDEMSQHYFTQTLPFDGTNVKTVTYDDNKVLVSLKWDFNNKSFSLSIRPATSDGPSGADYTEIWTLDNDGKTLIVERVPFQANGYNMKAYYDKK